ncbi:HD-GYP domain-containing protein [Gemmatimonas phototrophica]|uniref:HD-GYP domain-containing protein n=1 Tax=Gemmatimonas phototrophica TaxID=1379270 RepID=UPI0006A7015E|nr:HD-GYP domain-containing protein [Gemmatimonas phototrophica]
MKTSVIAYVYGIVATSVAALVFTYWYDPSFSMGLFIVPAILAFVAFLGAISKYRIQGSTFGEISHIPYLTAIILYPSWATLCAIGVGATLAEVTKKKPAIKRTFNVAQIVLAGCVAVLAYRQLGGVSLQQNRAWNFWPHSTAVVLFLTLNTYSVAVAIALAEGSGILKTWAKGSAKGFLVDIAAIFVVYAFGRAYVDWGGWGVALFCAMLVMLRFTYQSMQQLETTNRELLELFVHTVEYRDPYTSGHSQRVKRFSRIIAQEIGLSPKEVEKVSRAALLHDVGKIHEIFGPILMKPGRLTPEERAIMELHPIKSAELVAKISELQDIVPAVRHHHENWDGTGYPDRLKGKEIPLESRIIMFADTIDAMTTDRPYRKALGETEVRSELQKWRGIQFDPSICDALLSSPNFARIFDKNDNGGVYSLTQIFDAIRKKRVRTPAVA